MNCVKCGSDKIIRNEKLNYLSHLNIPKNLSISIQKTDNAFFNKYAESDFLAQICCGCGNVELTVNNPEALWEAYQESKK
jgi:hypothetical protein